MEHTLLKDLQVEWLIVWSAFYCLQNSSFHSCLYMYEFLIEMQMGRNKVHVVLYTYWILNKKLFLCMYLNITALVHIYVFIIMAIWLLQLILVLKEIGNEGFCKRISLSFYFNSLMIVETYSNDKILMEYTVWLA